MRRKHTICIVVGIVVLAGFAAYAASLGSQALFHISPSVYTAGVMDNSYLKGPRLLGQIFTSNFTIYTYGKYRPLGYALFALLNSFVDGVACWRLVLVVVHLVNSLLVFATLKRLVDDIASGALAVLWAVLPVFVPVVGDVNSIYLLWGMQFLLLAVLCWQSYVQKRSWLCFVASGLFFAASVFTWGYAAVAIPVMVLLALFPERWGRAAVCVAIVLCVVFLLTALAGVPVLVVTAITGALLLIAGAASGVARRRFLDVAAVIVSSAVLLVARFMVARSVGVPNLYLDPLAFIEEAKLSVPFQVSFVLGGWLSSSLFLASLIVAVVGALGLVLWRKVGYFLIGAGIILSIVTTLNMSLLYRDDVKFWSSAAVWSRDSKVKQAVQYNLAKAYRQAGQTQKARDLLFELLYVTGCGETLQRHLYIELGKLYESCDNDKLAGYYYFQQPTSSAVTIATQFEKGKVVPVGDFLFRLGYLSFAENFYASGLIHDPYDAYLDKRLGLVLLYKNYYRAARRKFRQALSHSPHDPESYYYLAFLSSDAVLADKRAYQLWSSRWKETTGKERLDFQPIFDGYHFNREQARDWFSSNPWYMFFGGTPTDSKWSYDYQGKLYLFWEVPREIGKFLYQREHYLRARDYLREAYKLKADSREILTLLSETSRRLGFLDEAREYQRRAEKLKG